MEFGEAVATIGAFVKATTVNGLVNRLEPALDGVTGDAAADVGSQLGVTPELLEAAQVTRAGLGRISDIIHALGIMLALPLILEPDEHIVNRPSLAAGNDPSRPYDLETNLRVAEFKFAVWDSGSNAIRKRGAFKDLMVLQADMSKRRKALYVVGHRPGHFLRTGTSTVAWALNKNLSATRFFADTFGPPEDVRICDFVAESGVEILDLAANHPDVFGVFAEY